MPIRYDNPLQYKNRPFYSHKLRCPPAPRKRDEMKTMEFAIFSLNKRSAVIINKPSVLEIHFTFYFIRVHTLNKLNEQ